MSSKKKAKQAGEGKKAAKKAGKKGGAVFVSGTTETLSLGDLATALATVLAKVKALGLSELSPADRQHTNGKLRGGEEKALSAILDCVDVRPGMFASLAARDHGDDETVVETGPSREALANVALLEPLVAQAEAIWRALSDELIAQGEQLRDVTTPAYAILKVNVAGDPKLAATAKPATDFYGRRPTKKKAAAPAK